MQSARELLQQADALMRRNRRRDRSSGGGDTTPSGDDATVSGPSRDVPTLTDALAVDAGAALLPTVILPHAPEEVDADPISFDTLSDLPVLTDVVDIGEIHDLQEAAAPGIDSEPLVPEEAGTFATVISAPVIPEPSAPDAALPETDASAADLSAAIGSGATDSGVPVPPPIAFVDEDFILEIPLPEQAVAAEGAEGRGRATEAADEEPGASGVGPAPGDLGWGSGPERDPDGQAEASAPAALPATSAAAGPEIERASPDWDALADEIRAQVMQRLDLFTDTGLREQLGARLQPIVQRASAELVETINRQVGELVRSYVAEAIEREID